jgi:Icc protein
MSDLQVGGTLPRRPVKAAIRRHFEDCFGPRDSVRVVPVGEGRAKGGRDRSTKPDLDEREVGREHCGRLDAEFRGWTEGPRIMVIHHHILAVPSTGRDATTCVTPVT